MIFLELNKMNLRNIMLIYLALILTIRRLIGTMNNHQTYSSEARMITKMARMEG
jgi:hypothetical protein